METGSTDTKVVCGGVASSWKTYASDYCLISKWSRRHSIQVQEAVLMGSARQVFLEMSDDNRPV